MKEKIKNKKIHTLLIIVMGFYFIDHCKKVNYCKFEKCYYLKSGNQWLCKKCGGNVKLFSTQQECVECCLYNMSHSMPQKASEIPK